MSNLIGFTDSCKESSSALNGKKCVDKPATKPSSYDYFQRPHLCPYCHADGLYTSTVHFYSAAIRCKIICLNCKQDWTSEFTLNSVIFKDEKKNEN